MIPNQEQNADFDFIIVEEPTHTYRLHYEEEAVTGYNDGLDAMRQVVYKILQTERYQYIIYSWNFGVELADLFGQSIPYVYSEIKRRITEALLQDLRITTVDNFEFSHTRGRVLVAFDVTTTEGSLRAEREVPV